MAEMNRFQENLEKLKGQSRLRSLTVPGGIDFTSNDYLGMRSHPKLRAAALAAIESGIELGAGGSRLLRGHTPAHQELEEFAAAHFSCERTLYFATGYQANMAIFTTLPDRHDVILFDALIHASARDGIQASAARHVRVAHNDVQAYEEALKNTQGKAEHIWIAVESVYSMDGDLAPLAQLQELAAEYGATLIVDEAHGTGVFGPHGKGLSEGLRPENLITLHTCGKAIGVAGGLICARGEIIDTLINRARSFIYSTAPPPLQAHLVQKSLEILEQEPQRRAKLFSLIDLANSLLPVPDSSSQIIPVILGDDARSVEVAASLQEAGFDIRAIRPPTVPENTARLRLSLNTNLDGHILRNLANVLIPHLQAKAA